jgi:hypothetical protein
MRDPTTNVTIEALIRETEARLRLWRWAWERSAPPERKRGRGRPQTKTDFHFQIAAAVGMLVEGSTLEATRSHAKRRLLGHSACSVVQAALARLGEHISERSIEDIWRQYEHVFSSKHRPY